MDRWTVTCVSPLLAMNENGHACARFPVEEVETALGVAVRVEKSWTRVATVGGVWGHLPMPRPQVPALAPGSSFILVFGRAVTRAELWAIEERGLGLRRGEGFGRVVLGTWHPGVRGTIEAPAPTGPKVPDDPEALAVLRRLALQRAIARCGEVEPSTVERRNELASLRRRLGRGAMDANEVTKHLSSLLNGESVGDWIRARVSGGDPFGRDEAGKVVFEAPHTLQAVLVALLDGIQGVRRRRRQ